MEGSRGVDLKRKGSRARSWIRAALTLALVSLTASAAGAAPPVLETLEPLVVAPGETGRITSELLAVVDPDTHPGFVLFTIESAPSHGSLFDAAPLGVGDAFSQYQLDNGTLWYAHDGGTSVDDAFVFSVSDGSGGAIGPTTFPIEITAPPAVPSLGPTGLLSLCAALLASAWLAASRQGDARGA